MADTLDVVNSPLRGLSPAQQLELAVASRPELWAKWRLQFVNGPLHLEWYRLMREQRRLAVVAPREHAKTQVFTVNQTAWRSIYEPGTWTYVFALTAEQGHEMKARIDGAVEQSHPSLLLGALSRSLRETVYANGSRVTVAGAGKAVRGSHPDVIIGDDVLEEATSMSARNRDQVARWWFGTVGNMAHPGTTRVLPGGKRMEMGATRIFLVGTPFHEADLLMSMKDNPMYAYRRYSAEFREGDLVSGSLAVEIS